MQNSEYEYDEDEEEKKELAKDVSEYSYYSEEAEEEQAEFYQKKDPDSMENAAEADS